MPVTVLSVCADRYPTSAPGNGSAPAVLGRAGGAGPSPSETSGEPLTAVADPAAPGVTAPGAPAAAGAAFTVTLAIPLAAQAMTPEAHRLLAALRDYVELHGSVVAAETVTAAVDPSAATARLAAVQGGGVGDHRRAPAGLDRVVAVPHQVTRDRLGAGPGTAEFPPGARYASDQVVRHRFTAAGAMPAHGAADVMPAHGDPAGAQAVREVPTTPPTAVDPHEVRLLAASRQVQLGGRPLTMTRLEFDLLLFFVEHPRRVHARGHLLDAVWGSRHAGERTVDVHVRRLRAKLGAEHPLITTVYGVGYRLDEDARIVVVADG